VMVVFALAGAPAPAMEEAVVEQAVAKSSVTVLEEADGIIHLSIETSKGTVQVLSDIAQEGATVVLSKLHIDGLTPGALGRAGINEMKAAAAEFFAGRGASEIIIEGFRRTSGKMIGTIPRVVRIIIP